MIFYFVPTDSKGFSIFPFYFFPPLTVCTLFDQRQSDEELKEEEAKELQAAATAKVEEDDDGW